MTSLVRKLKGPLAPAAPALKILQSNLANSGEFPLNYLCSRFLEVQYGGEGPSDETSQRNLSRVEAVFAPG